MEIRYRNNHTLESAWHVHPHKCCLVFITLPPLPPPYSNKDVHRNCVAFKRMYRCPDLIPKDSHSESLDAALTFVFLKTSTSDFEAHRN